MRRPRARAIVAFVATHEVLNQPPPLEVNLFAADLALRQAVEREGAAWATAQLLELGQLAGSRTAQAWAAQANENAPRLRTHDRYGNRVDEVEFHPAWHELMRVAVAHGIHCLPWEEERPGAHVARAALMFLDAECEQGHGCPISMTYSAVPALRRQPDLAREWEPRIATRSYDPRSVPAAGKSGALIGMAMERVFLRRLRGQDLGQVLMTIGFALIFQDLALLIWGGDPYSIPVPRFLQGAVRAGELSFPAYRIFIIAVAVVVAALLWLALDRTRVGARIRAAVDDGEMAQGVGINVPVLSLAVFALGACLAAAGGVIGGAFLGVYPGADFEVLPYAFVVVIVGGLGSLPGAMVGSLLVGLLDNFGKALFPELSYFTLFAPMALILALRPTGLFGRA